MHQKLLIIAVVLMSMAISIANADKKIFCYFGSWAVYRPGNGRFDINNIDPTLCTHLIYTFIGLKGNKVDILDPWADLSVGGGKGGFEKFNKLRENYPHLKTLVAIGGWNQGSARYSYMSRTEKGREEFAADVTEFVRRYNFNGLDFDWEYPAQRGGVKDDVVNYIELLKVLKRHFQGFNLILSAAVAPTRYSASQSYIIPEMIKYLDFINIMTYDFHVSTEPYTDVHAPLYRGSRETEYYKEWNIEDSVKYWLSQGCPNEKLMLGVPFYGRTFTLCDPNDNLIGAKSCGVGEGGQYSNEDGMMGYNEICEEFLMDDRWLKYMDPERVAPYAHKDHRWISFDDTYAIKKKAEFIKKWNLGGAMVWSIETDDFRGICGEKYPLLKTLNSVLRNVH